MIVQKFKSASQNKLLRGNLDSFKATDDTIVVCKYMYATQELRKPCCGNYIICRNPESPIFEAPKIWWAKKCNLNQCKFYKASEST